MSPIFYEANLGVDAMRVVGVLCEGRTDYFLLQAVLLAIHPEIETQAIQPTRDALQPDKWGEAGWPKVREWCQARSHEDISDELESGGVDLLVLQVDADVCGSEDLPATPAELCKHIRTHWLDGVPRTSMVVCIPSLAIDTWLAAALDPTIDETERDPVGRLVQLGVLQAARPGERGPRKSQYAYRERAPALRVAAPTLRTRLPELDRFMTKLEALKPG